MSDVPAHHSFNFRLAVLHNPHDPLAPSNPEFFQQLQEVGKSRNIQVTLLQKDDYKQLSHYDALFIRETTFVHHYTYTWARKAEALNIPVIDDADSIMLCNNKLYMMELFRAHKLPRPLSAMYTSDTIQYLPETFKFPVVLKLPSASFSAGVIKADDLGELATHTEKLFKISPYVLAQEFMPTDFDWRIGILGGKFLFACKYYMVPGHWQILRHLEDGSFRDGDSETFSMQNTPTEALQLALEATSMIGHGLYGVDLKESNGRFYLMEINDNPNLEAGTEDLVDGAALYNALLDEFEHRALRTRG